jgi:hypothetical protein
METSCYRDIQPKRSKQCPKRSSNPFNSKSKQFEVRIAGFEGKLRIAKADLKHKQHILKLAQDGSPDGGGQ